MDDEDGTCLLDVLCDPQALNDFLHGTNELESGDLLINPSAGDTSLFTDTTSPVSLLADDPPSQDAPPPGCVDLSFLEEALLGAPQGSGGLGDGEGEQEGGTAGEGEEEEACDILRQSLQEADITEQTLAQEAGLAQPGESLSLYPPGTLLPAPTHFLPKPLTTQPLVPKDTQGAVEPPQPSLLAVGPGCPSLKPTAPQLMGLLPGTVFPAPTSEPSFSLNPAQSSGVLIQKALPSLNGRPLFTAPAIRASPSPSILLPRGPLPIQPKLPVSIQPRLVQISPKPPGQKTPPGLTFVSGTPSPNILLSTPSAKQPPQPSQGLTKPLSLQLLNQTGSIVIQPQGIFPAPNQFILPGQPPVSGPQPHNTARPIITTAGPAGQAVRRSPSSQLVDGTQILTAPPGQLNFSPVFTTPTGQLAVRQGAILSGHLQLQSAAPAIFQMPAHLAGTFAPQAPGQRGTLLHSTTLGNHITLLNSQGVLGPTVNVQQGAPPDLASVSIVNGPPVVQGLPFAPQGQCSALAGAEGPPNLQPPALLLPERPREVEGNTSMDGVPSEEQLIHLPQPSDQNQTHIQPAKPIQSQPQPELQLIPHAVLQPQVVTSLQPHLPVQLQNQQGLQKKSLAPESESHCLEEGRSVTPLKQLFVHHLQQTSQSTPPVNFLSPTSGQTVTLAVSGTGQGQVVSPLSPVPRPGKAATLGRALTPGGTVPSPQSPSVLPPGPLPVPGQPSAGPRTQTDPAAHHRTLGKPATVLAVDGKVLTLGLHPASPKVQGPPFQGPLIQTLLTGSQAPVPAVSVNRPVNTLLRRQRFQQQLCSDHGSVVNPDINSPFSSLEDTLGRLLPYHTCVRALPSSDDFHRVDEQFEAVSSLLLKRTQDMLNKYRQLLLQEARQVSPSAEMVMLERLFLQDERSTLGEEKRMARLDPESFIASLYKPVSEGTPGSPATQSPPLKVGSSSPPWAMLSNRPPGLKTYRSSSRGGLKLTIKHEAGSRKVVHNSACESRGKSVAVIHTGQNRECREMTNGNSGRGLDFRETPQSPTPPPLPLPLPPPTVEGPKGEAQKCGPDDKQTAPELASTKDLPTPDNHLCPPQAKRSRPGPEEEPGTPPEDSALSEHLQSAIDSILELQRLQGPLAPDTHSLASLQDKQERQGALALEEAVNSILDEQM
ncbi:BRD4-interacting chromatin-remodeling complex-associated protein [Amia ocellicauda]|uniref:BRD4-interacting chromatin-remodeling complex-associated protein n=1 Tax=Amia ocellicauda TaxID=2972642 RepID=UPI0034639603